MNSKRMAMAIVSTVAATVAVGAVMWVKISGERNDAVERIIGDLNSKPAPCAVVVTGAPGRADVRQHAPMPGLALTDIPPDSIVYPFPSLSVPGSKRGRPEVLDGKPSWREQRAFVRDWAARDPKAAAQWAVVHIKDGGDRAFAVRTAAMAWSSKDAKVALVWADGLTNEAVRESALCAVFDAWAAKDPAAAAAALSGIGDFGKRDLVLGSIALQWCRQDARAALAWAWKLPAGPGRVYALSNIARLMQLDKKSSVALDGKTSDPSLLALASLVSGSDLQEAARKIALQLPGGREVSPAIALRAGWWAVRDPEAAVAWAMQMPAGRDGEQALAIVAQALAPTDPKVAARIAALMPAGEKKNATVRRVAAELSKHDAAAAGQWAESLPADGSRESAAAAAAGAQLPDPGAQFVLNDIFFKDMSLAVTVAEQLPDGEMRDGVIHAVAVEWARTDPVAAMGWAAAQLPPGRISDTAEKAIIWDWTARDPDAAVQWAVGLEGEIERGQCLSEVVQASARIRPGRAAELLEIMPAGDIRNFTVGQVAFQWAVREPAAAADWAVNLSTEQGRDYAISRVAACKAGAGVDNALSWASALPDGLLRDSALGGIAGVLAITDVERAGSIAGGLVEGVGREQALSAIGARYGRKDPAGGVIWIESLPLSRSRDIAVGSYTLALVESAPETACNRAMSITDTALRLSTLGSGVKTWAESNRTAAMAWVTGSSLSPSDKDAILLKFRE